MYKQVSRRQVKKFEDRERFSFSEEDMTAG